MALPISTDTRRRIAAIALLALCAVSVAAPRPWHSRARGLALGAARPPHRALAAAHNGLRRALDRFALLWRSADQLRTLRDENRALREALARQADQTRRTRQQLRSLQAFQTFRASSPVRTLAALPARVLAADPSPWRHHLIVDRGSADGARLGAAAVSGHTIVGTVVDIRPHAATVRLLTDAAGGLAVRVAHTGHTGFLQGTGQRRGPLRLKWVALRPPQQGDMLVTAELDPIIPPGLVAGRVLQTATDVRPIVYEAPVAPLLTPDQLTELLLVTYTPDDVDDLLEPRDGATP